MHRAEGKKAYLGDGVYVVFEYGSIVLTTENGIETTNRIVLEPDVFYALDDWIEATFGKRKTADTRAERPYQHHEPV